MMLNKKMSWMRRCIQLGIVTFLLQFLAYCISINKPPTYQVGYVEEGIASWYGPGFHGNQTANGERYDMHKMTAAHRTLPFGSVIQVTNLDTNQHVTVRINDRGPFIRGRIIDVSYEAARTLHMISKGTTRVRIRISKLPEAGGSNGPFWVQVSSFSDYGQATAMRNQLKRNYPAVRLVSVELSTGKWYRVQVGKFSTEFRAKKVADQLKTEWGVSPTLIAE